MAVDSNRPYRSVYNNGDSIWDGAAWGAAAGVGATGVAYGVGVHGAKHLGALNRNMAINFPMRDELRNQSRIDKGRKHFSEADLAERAEKRGNIHVGIGKGIDRVQNAGQYAFGSGRRAAITGAAGLLGGMMAGAGIDASR